MPDEDGWIGPPDQDDPNLLKTFNDVLAQRPSTPPPPSSSPIPSADDGGEYQPRPPKPKRQAINRKQSSGGSSNSKRLNSQPRVNPSGAVKSGSAGDGQNSTGGISYGQSLTAAYSQNTLSLPSPSPVIACWLNGLYPNLYQDPNLPYQSRRSTDQRKTNRKYFRRGFSTNRFRSPLS